MTPAATTRTLSTAEDRREAVLEAALPIFARRGLLATPTSEVAKAAGISHAYLFRLFPTKIDLAVAVAGRCNERICTAFRAAVAAAKASGEEPLHAMGMAYTELISDPDLLLCQMHSFAASAAVPEIRETSQAGFRAIFDLVAEESGASDEELGSFFATGMLMNVLAALGADTSRDGWAEVLGSYCEKDDPS